MSAIVHFRCLTLSLFTNAQQLILAIITANSVFSPDILTETHLLRELIVIVIAFSLTIPDWGGR